MSNLLLLGGAPGAGKSTIARRLAKKHGLRLYAADTRTWIHRDRAIAAGNPAAIRWESLGPTERWEEPLEAMVAQSLHTERGAMVLTDLAELPPDVLVVAEGTTVPVIAVTDPGRALWLLPTPEFQDRCFRDRGMTGSVAALYRAISSLIERDAAARGLRVHRVDGSLDLAGTLALVERHFAVTLAVGPCAVTADQRQALLRAANEDSFSQVATYLERPWTVGDHTTASRDFTCECIDPTCDAQVRLTLADYRQRSFEGPMLAPRCR